MYSGGREFQTGILETAGTNGSNCCLLFKHAGGHRHKPHLTLVIFYSLTSSLYTRFAAW